MNKFNLGLVSLCLLISQSLYAKGPLGLGIIIGSPTGISSKYWLPSSPIGGQRAAIDAAAAYSLGKDSRFSLHADYLLQIPNALSINPRTHLDFYYGAGALFFASGDSKLALRIPAGLAHDLKSIPIDFFLEAAGVFGILPETNFDLQLAIGSRYYF